MYILDMPLYMLFFLSETTIYLLSSTKTLIKHLRDYLLQAFLENLHSQALDALL